MILQMVRKEYVKFGRRVDRQVIYKILWLNVPNNPQTLHNLPCFNRGCFEVVLIENTWRTLGVKFWI